MVPEPDTPTVAPAAAPTPVPAVAPTTAPAGAPHSAPAAAAHATPDPGRASPVRLGLALSGGGFRATLFHLGVLVRLAELDVLRHVQVLSAVSGGSILAAHYMLRLKAALEASTTGTLSREEYVGLVAHVRDELRAAIERQPRCLLLDGPLDVFRMLFLARTRWRSSLSMKMASLYQGLVFERATRELRGASAADAAGGMPLCRMHVRLPELLRQPDIERFNASGARDRVPKLVLNAATLNTGCKFTFTFSEIGDEMLGYVRCDERWLLAGYKLLLQRYVPAPDLLQAAERAATQVASARRAWVSGDVPGGEGRDRFTLRPHTAEHLAWWHAAHEEQAVRRELPGRPGAALEQALRARPGGAVAGRDALRSRAVRHLVGSWQDSLRFLEALPGTLRAAKVAAWYVLDREGWSAGEPAGPERRGGFTLAEHRERFWRALRDVDSTMAEALRRDDAEQDWMEFVLELYHFRVAENLHAGALEAVTLPTAVQASANFPPVFAPLHLAGLFDGAKLNRLRLSDGGLNDNNGIETLLDERCTHIIASEAGPGPQVSPDVGLNRLGMMVQIVLNQLPIVRRLQLRALREQARVRGALAGLPGSAPGLLAAPAIADLWQRYPVEAVAFFQIDSKPSDGLPDSASPPPLAPHPLAQDAVRLRTDLDGFAPVEQDALLWQGYQYCDRFVRRYVYPSLAANRLVPAEPPAVRPPVSQPRTNEEWDHAKRVLVAGASMFARAWKFGRGWRVAYVLTVAALILAGFGVLGLALGVLSSLVHAPILPKAFSLGARWVVGWIVFSPLLLWAALVLFGKWVRLDGVLADLASRSAPPAAADRQRVS